ncbi:MAG: hypothetical protein HC809_15945, partial [Gammaproteobacteria bacterium]|nr:hypothetical protein [Gammaproteobacteria bacterium]
MLQTASGLRFVDVRYPVSFDGDTRHVTPRVSFPFEEDALPIGSFDSLEVHRTDSVVTIAALRGGQQLTLTRYRDAEPGLPLEFGQTHVTQLEDRYEQVLFGPRGDWIYLIDKAGVIEVFDIVVPSAPKSVFRGRLVPEQQQLIAIEPLVGRYSLLV